MAENPLKKQKTLWIINIIKTNTNMHKIPNNSLNRDCPIVVDLDGTLLKTDVLYESILVLLKRNPGYIFFLFMWVLHGRAQFKREIANRVTLSPQLLPYREEVLHYLRDQYESGRHLILATATDELLAKPIADHIGLFHEIIASNGTTNLSGKIKAHRIHEILNGQEFEYIGNSWQDIPIWITATYRSVAGASSEKISKWSQKVGQFTVIFQKKTTWRMGLRLIRIHQWTKNLLIFVPVFVGQVFTAPGVLLNVFAAFFSICFVASGGYIINDLWDLEADRAHPDKRRRPLASGQLPITHGFGIAFIFFAMSLTVAVIFLPGSFLYVLLGYFTITLLYSYKLKHIVLLDVLVLSSLYGIRLVAGATACEITLSHWLLVFSLFMFVSLAFAKRYVECQSNSENKHDKITNRGYRSSDLIILACFGSAAGFVAVLLFGLYLQSAVAMTSYSRPNLLWFILPVLLYWISHVWLIAHRGEMVHDPVVFAITDKPSILSGIVCVCLTLAAM